jgi:hypothetical protein
MLAELWPHWAEREKAWQKYMHGGALFTLLSQEIASELPWPSDDWLTPPGTERTLPGLVEWWRRNAGTTSSEGSGDALRRWQVFAQILWCFDEARRIRRMQSRVVDRHRLKEWLPEFDASGIRRYEGSAEADARLEGLSRASMCIRAFLGTRPRRAGTVPIALYALQQQTGFLASLELELLPEGTGEIALHLGNSFDTSCQLSFERSMGHAWKMAMQAMSPAPVVDGRWHVVPLSTDQSQEQEFLEVSGASAGGAAARGWWHLLNRKVPDDGVVVLARVSPDCTTLGSVDHIAQKVQAILANGRSEHYPTVDTIVVVGIEASRIAAAALRDSQGIQLVSLPS